MVKSEREILFFPRRVRCAPVRSFFISLLPRFYFELVYEIEKKRVRAFYNFSIFSKNAWVGRQAGGVGVASISFKGRREKGTFLARSSALKNEKIKTKKTHTHRKKFLSDKKEDETVVA